MTKKNPDKTLVVVAGPTAVGKTALSVRLARLLQTEVVSADARQFYRELPIGTASPGPEILNAVRHHFIGQLSVHDYYNVSLFEQEALKVLENIFERSDHALLCGGSGLYIDTLCFGIDPIPEIEPAVRQQLIHVYNNQGMLSLRNWLRKVDPDYYSQADLANPKRVMRGLEVYLQTGVRLSELQTKKQVSRPFRIKYIVLSRERPELFSRINARVDQMIRDGIIEEALPFFRYRDLNALNTVGYKEIFDWVSGVHSLAHAIEKIKTNTRRFAKRQLTWFRRHDTAVWFHPDDEEDIVRFISE